MNAPREPYYRAPPASARAEADSAGRYLLLAVFLGYLLLLPPQLNLSIGGSSIPPYRFFLIAASVFVLPSFIKGRVRLTWVDLAIFISIVWIWIAMSQTSTFDETITSSVAHTADIGFAYIFGRAAFRTPDDLRRFLILMLPGLLITGLVITVESITHTHIIQGVASALTGKPLDYRADPRFGLMRAWGPFPHPISAGVFMSSFLALYWLAGYKGWLKFTGTIAAGLAFFSVSSAALLALASTIGLLFYNWLTKCIADVSWRLFFFVAGLFIFVAELGTKSGTFSLLMRFASFNSVSGYQRVNIWNFGTDSVEKHPWFGIGYGDWERPVWMGDSVDNYWLLLAMRFGVLPSVLLVFATVLTVIMIVRKSATSPEADQNLQRGVAMAISVFALGLISVAVWLSTQVWYFVLLGLAVSLATAPSMQLRKTSFDPRAARPADNALPSAG